ncbi:GNAT family N-acetyltransferase [Catenulispora sp. NF23]|uniref:GNAT family N-acetyltransferase n=1 Tax=Catenulispora pinistramenti TaxID=2705254 RepID=UPI001BAC928C|nr:GNAT family N-acetyltransferase [Catenulispora pinistramenti]MBS2532568.1 GNAT family N-acetyltransferase [Catenulispora pinistramenti]
MSSDPLQAVSQTITIAPARAGDAAAVQSAVKIGNTARGTLGHLPFAAYEDAAQKGCLLLARNGQEIIGYALYGLTRAHVRLTHLCVRPDYRGRGIARQLVERIVEERAGCPGIRASCRHSYGLGKMWASLGFSQVAERPGRSDDGHILVIWWRDHGHPNLLSRQEELVLVRAAVDLNVVRALAGPHRKDAADVRALMDDQIVDRLELVRTAALNAEIDTIESSLRAQCTRCIRDMSSVQSSTATAGEARNAIIAALEQEAPGYPLTAQDMFDLRHACDAIAAGLNVLITSDRRMIKTLGPACEQRFGLRIMLPVDVITHLDELVRAEAYRPAGLLGTAWNSRLLGPGDAARAGHLVGDGERPKAFQDLLGSLARDQRERVGVLDPTGYMAAVYCAFKQSGELVVPLARVAPVSLSDTLARQIIFLLRQLAKRVSASTIRLTDDHVSRSLRLAALEDGFQPVADGLVAYCLNVCGTAEEISHRAVLAARNATLSEPPLLRSVMPSVAAAEIERVWWPAKVIDSALASYLVPIQQAYSNDLLGIPETLDGRRDQLGLSREHVYYRGPRGPRPTAPSRLLWYMSGGGRTRSQSPGVIACSQLDAVVTGEPQELHSRFRHLGVWNEQQIVAAAHEGQVQALVFTNTEILPRPVGLRLLREIAARHGEQPTPQGPLRISAEYFSAIYRAGQSQS